MKSKSLLSLSELKNPILQFRFVLSKTTLKLQLHVHVHVLLEAFLLVHAVVIDLLLLILQMAVFNPKTDEVRYTNDYVPSNNARIQPSTLWSG